MSTGPSALVADGYRVCTDLNLLLALMAEEEIGITLSENQLDVDQSTSVIVIKHLQAKYLSV
jgi:cobalamin-dependent methionine synthase I